MSAAGKARLIRVCNCLSLKRTVTCRAVPASGVPYRCTFCTHPINVGDTYREGMGARAHDFCFKAVVREYAPVVRAGGAA